METYQDPSHHFNGIEYHTGKQCIEQGCTEPAGTAWSVHWCQKCNAKRMKRIVEILTRVRVD